MATAGLSATPAKAHQWRHSWRASVRRQPAAPANPVYAAMVVDENSGRTIYAASENELRHPASLTKVMTLYLLFEQLDRGRMTLGSPIAMSEHAASQAPSKLGLEPGETISVDNAIKAIVTRSANDVAVAIGEAVAGDEDSFAQMMTRKARALGMAHTTYVNASGLPDDRQITTAHDLTILGRAVEERFPRYFHYFSTHSFDYAGETIGNHNHLLGRVDGVDGIKTGYTRASGFNLLTSVHRGGRSLVAVVMGGPTAAARDRAMESLIAQHIASATTAHTATMIADTPSGEPARIASAGFDGAPPVPPARAPALVAWASTALPPARAAAEGEGDNDSVERDPPATALAPARHGADQTAAASLASAYSPIHEAQTAPAALGWVKGPEGIARPADPARKALIASLTQPAAPPSPAPVARDEPPGAGVGATPSPAARPPAAAKAAPAQEESHVARADPARSAPARDAWIVQIGATDDAGKANELLIRARAANRSTLASARPLTEKVGNGGSAFYRARFAGLDSSTAEAACKSLKRSGFSCFATRE
ncbi:MAG: D-alanyl-D-alanine carboxypeptidase [Roseiarcus sp.]|jgi:D-alanyl-D-alanine carboxypeptidase